MLVFKQQIKEATASVSFYGKQLAVFYNVEEKNSFLTSFIPKAKLPNLETFEFNTASTILLSTEDLMALLTRARAHSNFQDGNSILAAELPHCSPSA